MYQLAIREKEIFNTLKKIKKYDFVVIGGYAVNVYTLPRFSIDCDIVILNSKEARKIENELINIGYFKTEENKLQTPYHGKFIRYEKIVEKEFKVSFDLLIGKVLDRQTGATFNADWIFDNSSVRSLKGKVISDVIKAKIPHPEALIIMKLLSCRSTDIRDIFMMIVYLKDFKYVKKEISKRAKFQEQFKKIKEKINSKSFRDNLQGVFGFIQEKTFNKHKELILKLGKNN